ncbi:TonB-dependent receptor [Cognaticolwellia beringensis]|uniref:TonB-dependent receptor n=1 Tax=Cognaticolwellia beringensis TaxID=1967665 RepID=A0A222G637_9GAMM|nr:TonB-dependent receptor [Cognaticolwellia beringensis]ASP47202.1 TonB-dependent receptor [Cognaticolwellia beringensis]
MATFNKLNKISCVVRKQASYPKQFLCASTLLTLLAFPAVAAEEESEKKVDAEIEVIEVSGGLRRTMTRSLNEKKNSTAIVDAVAAADFGDLPGLSLSDVIENISGASGHRLKGSQNEISIRGLGSYWGYSTFNGRTITNAGPGRAVNFKKFPSELVDKVVIYKSQQADLVEGGTSGTIDVNSLRAVDYGEAQTTVQATGVYNDYYSDVDGDTSPWGKKFVISTVQQWETEDLGDMGFTLGLNHSDSANPEENFGGSSQMAVCALRAADGSNLIGGSNCATGQQGVSSGRVGREPELGIDTDLADFDQSSIFYVPNDAYWRTGEDEDVRTGAVFTFQWIPRDDLEINIDYEYSDLEYTEKRMELALDSRRDDLADHIIADDHTLLYATGEARPTLQGEDRNQVDEYRGGGIEIEYSPTEDLTLALDLSYSESYRYRLRQRTKFRSTERYNYALDFRGRNVPTLTWLDDNRLGPDDSGFVGSDVFDASDMGNFVNDDHAYVEYRRAHEERNDDIFAINLDGEYQLDNEYFSSVKVGVRYSKEHLLDYVTNDVSLVLADGTQRYGSSDNEDNNWDGLNPDANSALINGIIDNCQNGHSNNIQFTEEPGSGGDATRYATYDHKCFIGQVLGQLPGATSTDYYDIGEREDGRDGADRDVTETITAGYVMANFDAEIGGIPVYGNVGVRVVTTKTESEGWGDKVYITTDEETDTYAAEINPTGDIERVTLASEYTEVLPSLNLTFHVTDEFYVRTAAYRSMSRFQLNAMSAGVSYETCEDEDDTICDAATNNDYSEVIRGGEANGNHLDPYTALNYDLSFEYYPSEDAAVTLALYHKSFTGGYETNTEQRDIIVNLDGVDTTYTGVSHLVKQTSTDESVIKGVEITAQKHFVELPAPFNGLGAKVAWNYASSDFVTEEPASAGIVPDANLFGFSKNVASASVYWEGDNTTVRLMWKYRSKYLQPNSLPFPDRSHRYVQDAVYMDMSAKYKINSNVSVFVKGLNLTNEPQLMTRGNDTTIADYSRSGTKWEFGVKAKF